MMSEEEVKKTGEDIVELFRSVRLIEESQTHFASSTNHAFPFPMAVQ